MAELALPVFAADKGSSSTPRNGPNLPPKRGGAEVSWLGVVAGGAFPAPSERTSGNGRARPAAPYRQGSRGPGRAHAPAHARNGERRRPATGAIPRRSALANPQSFAPQDRGSPRHQARGSDRAPRARRGRSPALSRASGANGS